MMTHLDYFQVFCFTALHQRIEYLVHCVVNRVLLAAASSA